MGGVYLKPPGFNIDPDLKPTAKKPEYTKIETPLDDSLFGGVDIMGGVRENDFTPLVDNNEGMWADQPDDLLIKQKQAGGNCKEECSADLCEQDKRAICSASNRIYSGPNKCEEHDEFGCHHTSCSACSYSTDISFCGQCMPSDKQCLKKFGLCMKDLRRRLKSPDRKKYLNEGLKFACYMPDCPNEM